jgi:hypothetical protein
MQDCSMHDRTGVASESRCANFRMAEPAPVPALKERAERKDCQMKPVSNDYSARASNEAQSLKAQILKG